MGVYYPKSKGTWWSREFQAACIESYRAVMEGRYTRLDVQRHVENVPRFAEESMDRGFPSWEQIRKWAREYPNLPEEVRGKDFLSDFKPLQLGTGRALFQSPAETGNLINRPYSTVYPSPAWACQAQSDNAGWYVIMQRMMAMVVFACMFSLCNSLLRSLAEQE